MRQVRERLIADLDRERERAERLERELADARRPWWWRWFRRAKIAHRGSPNKWSLAFGT